MKVKFGSQHLLIGGLVLLVQACSPKYHLYQSKPSQYEVNANLPVDSNILSYYNPYKQKLDSIMNDIVVYSDVEIIKDKPEGLMNNFFGDAIAEASRDKGIVFDVAYSNYGGLRTALPKGPIPRSKIFELMPFENAIVTVKFKGTDMQSFFDFLARSGGDAISGARFKIDHATKKAVDITVNGKPLDITKDYIVLTSDYMANGGDGGEIFNKAIERKDQNFLLRDALLNYVDKVKRSGKTLNPKLDGRISIK
ncbi:5'-Nucleotidase domain-containing protein [Pseudopedobacter saltans DSM 12145]|uniref:5'-Nucleotidase domain-containing protein n=1 Tax=Pseudopedobacter saltans (strain ATCC 51119 / DSM 12145 / JCM 21818 / CCUG 39354 / LMG 10337 / NBRC 100064 / NCIMB 13643) TaxID=762903 RepID=F0S7X3_PSESL|nr:5'-nucleotidase C-terminal domain-containing protein [Pseudopedobacter saltans]ADY54381.1 5'-Nucleotidase domain-containing protein [Pseudopedobacter saltans DSM 12145]